MSGRTGASGGVDVLLLVFLVVVALATLALLLHYTTGLLGSLPDPLPVV